MTTQQASFACCSYCQRHIVYPVAVHQINRHSNSKNNNYYYYINNSNRNNQSSHLLTLNTLWGHEIKVMPCTLALVHYIWGGKRIGPPNSEAGHKTSTSDSHSYTGVSRFSIGVSSINKVGHTSLKSLPFFMSSLSPLHLAPQHQPMQWDWPTKCFFHNLWSQISCSSQAPEWQVCLLLSTDPAPTPWIGKEVRLQIGEQGLEDGRRRSWSRTTFTWWVKMGFGGSIHCLKPQLLG